MTACPKCGATSGNDWSQCEGRCPMPMSPHYREYHDGEHYLHIDWRPLIMDVTSIDGRQITLRMACGLLFNPSASTVVLIKKDHPDWMAGKYNGVGGKVGDDETFHQAMRREFLEEAGVEVDWEHFVTMTGPRRDNPNKLVQVQFFRAFSMLAYRAHTMESEPIIKQDLNDITHVEMVDHLRWLIPLALDHRIVAPVEFTVMAIPASPPITPSEEPAHG